ncbi:hypothetical protein ABK040_015860 [Willaertia magna]
MNGHFAVSRHLIEQGSDPNHLDSANNTVIHYAVAYGWKDIMFLLLKVGADIQALNSWKVSPLELSLLKNHTGIAEYILNNFTIDLNLKDPSGKTLIEKLLDRGDGYSIELVTFILERKRDSLNIKELNNLFYCITRAPTKYDIKLAEFFIDLGVSVDDVHSSDRESPVTLAFRNRNINMIKFLLKHNATITCPKHRDNILHIILGMANEFDVTELFKIFYNYLVKTKNNPDLFYEMAKSVNNRGLTPFMLLIENMNINGSFKNLAEDEDAAGFEEDYVGHSKNYLGKLFKELEEKDIDTFIKHLEIEKENHEYEKENKKENTDERELDENTLQHYFNEKKELKTTTNDIEKLIKFLHIYLTLTKTDITKEEVKYIPKETRMKGVHYSLANIGNTPLHFAIEKQSTDLIIALLEHYKLDVNKPIQPQHLAHYS